MIGPYEIAKTYVGDDACIVPRADLMIVRVAVPEKIVGLTLILDFFDRCPSRISLHLPPAALMRSPLRMEGCMEERCPVCGRVVATHLYVRNAEIVGCDRCVTPFEIWELPVDWRYYEGN